MASFASIEFTPTKWSVGTLDTLRQYATIIANHCELGSGEERDSVHYTDDTYFSWKREDCRIKLYWCDEPKENEWLCITIDCENNDAKDLSNKLLDKLNPFLIESHIFFRPPENSE